jgi:hypothetical protein
MSHARRLFAALLATTALCVAPTGFALEPQDNEAPWKWKMNMGDVTLYSAPGVGMTWSTGELHILSSSDVDHMVLACAGRPVTRAGVYFTHADGDIDIYVYDLGGNYLGSSQGVANEEFVDVRAFGKQAVVLKVYGYAGATNYYQVRVECV